MLNLFRKRSPATPPDAPALPEAPINRRRNERQDTYADMAAVSASGATRKRGIVLDLSDTGARIRFEHCVGIVDGMQIKIARYGIARPANVKWRTRTDVGVEFIPDQP